MSHALRMMLDLLMVRHHNHQMSSNISKHYVPIEVNCDGNEGSLSECENEEINLYYCCLGYEDAGVVCNGKIMTRSLILTQCVLYSHFRQQVQ